MGISIGWDNEEKTIMRFEYVGEWTWESFYENIEAANHLMDTVNHPVVSIIDMSASNHLPFGAGVHIRNVIRMSQSHNNSGISVFYNADRIVQAMIDVLKKSYPEILAATQWYYAKSLEEARRIAQQKVNELTSGAK